MPISDPTNFVLGRGGADWGAPTTGWWNTPSMRSYGPAPVGASFTGSTRVGGGGGTTTIPGYQPPSFNYAAGTAQGTGALTQLTDYINNLNRTAQTLANQARIPGAAGLEAQSSQNIGAGLRGEVPADVLALLQRQAAERGVGRGPESPSTNAAYLQALGLTSLSRQEEAQRDLTAAYARNPAAPLFDPTTQLLTPYQASSLELERQRAQMQADLEASRLELERERMRTAGAGGGGGYGGGRGATTLQQAPEYNPATRSYASGATGDILAGSIAPEFGQRQWWQSVGYGAGAPSSTGGGTFYAGPSYGGMTEEELYQNFGLTGEDYTSLGLTAEDLYP